MHFEQFEVSWINDSSNLSVLDDSSIWSDFEEVNLLLVKAENCQIVVVDCDSLVVVKNDEFVAQFEVVRHDLK